MKKGLFLIVVLIGALFFIPSFVNAHCDTLDGPVIATAKLAFEKGDVTPVLKWVQKDDETKIRELFKKTMAVRAKGQEAKELADLYFFETLVRIHRRGEGAPYTGLKPAGNVEPAVAAADKALETGSVDNLAKSTADAVAKGILERFERAKAAKKQADQSVEAGRKFVEAYIEFTHYVEKLDMIGAETGAHHQAEGHKMEHKSEHKSEHKAEHEHGHKE
ncbi:MAG: hypothetical protein HQK79_20320 [Desulfobacterales bacterium]|nr:hypothetical protein [Desulfobacterales bacterium]